jgi:hypothetical protein
MYAISHFVPVCWEIGAPDCSDILKELSPDVSICCNCLNLLG